MGLRGGEVSRLRAVHEAHFPTTCAIRRPVRSSDSAGGSTVTYPGGESVTTVACRLVARPVKDAEAGERGVALRERVVELPHGTDVQRDDQITVDGQVLYVADVMDQDERLTLSAVCRGIV